MLIHSRPITQIPCAHLSKLNESWFGRSVGLKTSPLIRLVLISSTACHPSDYDFCTSTCMQLQLRQRLRRRLFLFLFFFGVSRMNSSKRNRGGGARVPDYVMHQLQLAGALGSICPCAYPASCRICSLPLTLNYAHPRPDRLIARLADSASQYVKRVRPPAPLLCRASTATTS